MMTLLSENEMDKNIKELHNALQWDDKANDEQETSKFKDYTKVLKQTRKTSQTVSTIVTNFNNTL